MSDGISIKARDLKEQLKNINLSESSRDLNETQTFIFEKILELVSGLRESHSCTVQQARARLVTPVNNISVGLDSRSIRRSHGP